MVIVMSENVSLSLRAASARLFASGFEVDVPRRSWKSTDFQDSQKSPISVSGVPLVKSPSFVIVSLTVDAALHVFLYVDTLSIS